MVEGGASIIESFLAEASLHSTQNKASIVDTIIVTVAPTFVGSDGIGYGAGLGKEHVGHLTSEETGNGLFTSDRQIPKLQHIRTEVIGQDTVIAARLNP